ncbi:uncharacterized protein Z520_06138 [Fonsecaea multimorphosa CBS 102226]|uniref:CRIB domain-containing protein n=1 Tax=Fonsecaea multimorphosa CBS 102226 TaxID=1442371 RepID=A0A0D2K4F9_9EURO|nr:uncharacterized protein Z520_06138 [Fonsecaea multimorphosa CBS 102226]KIX98059.1 hypothetical protein Z520_06138 [Fonsecaea multimorphosa CBS 102226]OAL24425.1 hypothetical protein AYO22_05801 [Fonsecaea multimorphosa]
MGRFPWSQGSSKQSSDRLHVVAGDWFSKDNAEPSSQALSELIKEYSSVESGNLDISPKARVRSRTNTIASSFSANTRSLSDASNEMASRPSSRQSFVDGGLPLPERQESAAKTLLNKGTRMLKRQGSKLNLLPSQIEDRSSVVLAEARAVEIAPVKGLQRQPTLISRRLKRSISGPFAFQHLTHADQAHFQSLDSVSKTDLTSEFHAVHADQQPVGQIRGITVTDLPANGDEPKIHVGFDEPTSPTTNAIPYLPTTPTRPSPPPKDSFVPPYSPSDFRLSRSMENFSRPTRLSVAAVDISPSSDNGRRLSAMSPISHARALAKPLPHLPNDQVVHAVSTRDDIALPLRTAPLPSPPRTLMEVVEEENTEEKVIAEAVRLPVQPPIADVLASPSAKQRKRRSQSSGEIHFGTVSYILPNGSSNRETTGLEDMGGEASPKSKNRFSIAVKPIDIEDWEDAIDYSWEHAAELEDDGGDNASAGILDHPRALSIPAENYLVVEQPSLDEASSSASTPLTMQIPSNPPRDDSGPCRQLDQEPSSPLLGLGIESPKAVPTVSLDEAAVSDLHQPQDNFASTDPFRTRAMRSPVSTMSKSSSQESIIASIFGTHRSSNSSTSISDLAHLASFGNSVESLKLDLQDFGASVEKHFREGSQDTIREGSQSSKTTESQVIEPIGPFTTSPTIRHDRGVSASQIPVPERKSSMPGVELTKAQLGRKRATTASSRPRRNTRVSYSLFPTNVAT